MKRTLLCLAIALVPSAALAQMAAPRAGAAGCSGPQIDLGPVRICDLDPGRTVRAFCADGTTVDIVTNNGDAQVPESCSKPR
ncbi:MAG TPA: hypothetical protein VHW66_12515 [Stellaceae bacterium]|jgi:hypothetical protein|nr:hypothetical protein [Stellaceae bacterium]